MREEVTPRMLAAGRAVWERTKDSPDIAEIYAEMESARGPSYKPASVPYPPVALHVDRPLGELVQRFTMVVRMHDVVAAKHPRWFIVKELWGLWWLVMKELWRKS